MIKLTRQELIDITNEACRLLYDAGDVDTVLAFEENGGSVKPVLLTGSQANGKSDLFPRGTDPSDQIYMHLSALYGMDDSF